jgi:hypothetical protein
MGPSGGFFTDRENEARPRAGAAFVTLNSPSTASFPLLTQTGNLIDWQKAAAGHAHAMISDNRNVLSWLSVCGCDGSRRAFLLKAFAKNCAIVSRGSSP